MLSRAVGIFYNKHCDYKIPVTVSAVTMSTMTIKNCCYDGHKSLVLVYGDSYRLLKKLGQRKLLAKQVSGFCLFILSIQY